MALSKSYLSVMASCTLSGLKVQRPRLAIFVMRLAM